MTTKLKLDRLFYTERQVCELLCVSRTLLRKLMAKGEIRYTHIGRALRFSADAIEEYYERHEAA